MRPNFLRKSKILLLIALFGCIAGAIYQLINEKRIDHQSIIFGLPLGLVFGILELFLFPRFLQRSRQWSFSKLFFFKTILYTIVINVVIMSIIGFTGVAGGRKFDELVEHLTSVDHLVVVIFSLVSYSLLVLFVQINHLLGEGVLWKFITGKYHRPREEERIFMFLDMKSSTTIAEQLGHVKFYRLLNEIFHEISQPVLQTRAEIYQYVGDEVILTWEVKHGLENSNCLKAFFMFRDSLFKNRRNYIKNFGVSPEFKAGLHFGKVISAQIGDLKREIVYNGDVLNTTSRIQNECNKYEVDFLMSGELMTRLHEVNGFLWKKVNTVTLRGKETEMELFSITDEMRHKPTIAYHFEMEENL